MIASYQNLYTPKLKKCYYVKTVIGYKEFENFRTYLKGKTEDVYEHEAQPAVKRFLKAEITTIRSDITK